MTAETAAWKGEDVEAAGGVPLVVEGLTKSYGGRQVLKGISFSLAPREIMAVVGPNGAGKTTALEIIEGLRMPDRGRVRYFGSDVDGVTDAVRERIGVQLQSTGFLPHLTVGETLRLFANLYARRERVEGTLEVFDLCAIRKARVKTLSGGQRQRLALACAVVHDPELVFLDEPTTGLDTQSRHSLWGLIRELRERGKGIVITTHCMNEAEALADRVAIVDEGEIRALGSPRELEERFSQPDLESVFLAVTGRALR